MELVSEICTSEGTDKLEQQQQPQDKQQSLQQPLPMLKPPDEVTHYDTMNDKLTYATQALKAILEGGWSA